jgi:hypothetical protein
MFSYLGECFRNAVLNCMKLLVCLRYICTYLLHLKIKLATVPESSSTLLFTGGDLASHLEL